MKIVNKYADALWLQWWKISLKESLAFQVSVAEQAESCDIFCKLYHWWPEKICFGDKHLKDNLDAVLVWYESMLSVKQVEAILNEDHLLWWFNNSEFDHDLDLFIVKLKKISLI